MKKKGKYYNESGQWIKQEEEITKKLDSLKMEWYAWKRSEKWP